MFENEERQGMEVWAEYAEAFQDLDDLTLARWMAQTLSQLKGKVWRSSHPLLGTYRLAAEVSQKRQIWLKRLVKMPAGFREAPCCRSPLLPLVTRDATEGLFCTHCGGIAEPFQDLDPDLGKVLSKWLEEYEVVHEVAHWSEDERANLHGYEDKLKESTDRARSLLRELRYIILPGFLEVYPAVVWQDSDECLDIGPEQILEKR